MGRFSPLFQEISAFYRCLPFLRSGDSRGGSGLCWHTQGWWEGGRQALQQGQLHHPAGGSCAASAPHLRSYRDTPGSTSPRGPQPLFLFPLLNPSAAPWEGASEYSSDFCVCLICLHVPSGEHSASLYRPAGKGLTGGHRASPTPAQPLC